MPRATALAPESNPTARWRTRVLWLPLLATVVFTLGACTVKRGYHFMDWVMLWKIERYVDLHGEQKAEAKAALQQFEEWHQRTQLGQYADYLRELQARLNAGPVTSELIHKETDQVQVFLDQALNQLLPDVARIASTLSDKQVAELMDNLAKRRQKFIKEYVDLPPHKQVKKRYEKLENHLDNWLGGLTRTQEQWLQDWAESLEPYEQQTADQQAQLTRLLGEILKDRSAPSTLVKDLRQITLHRSDDWDPEIKAMVDRNQERTYALLAEILNNLTDKQKDKLNKKLTDYISDLTALAEAAQRS